MPGRCGGTTAAPTAKCYRIVLGNPADASEDGRVGLARLAIVEGPARAVVKQTIRFDLESRETLEIIPLPVENDSFNAQPEAPACPGPATKKAGASGWALNEQMCHSSPVGVYQLTAPEQPGLFPKYVPDEQGQSGLAAYPARLTKQSV